MELLIGRFFSFSRQVRLLRCSFCSSVNLDIEPEFDCGEFYRSEYFTGESGAYFENNYTKFLRSNVRLLSILKRNLAHQGRILMDLGAGHGNLDLVFSEKKLGVNVLNVDICNNSHRKENFYFHDMNTENYSDQLRRFTHKVDCITALDLIEHLESPENIFRFSDLFLRSGGILVLKYPDIESLLHRMNLILLRHFSLGTVGILGIPHIIYPSRKAMIQLIDHYGFTLQKEYNCPTYYGIFDESDRHILKRPMVRRTYKLYFTLCSYFQAGNKKVMILKRSHE